jgi:RNA polymerase sigma-70 factor (ECF subfamily)
MNRGQIEAELERLHGDGFAWALACCGRDREEAEDVLQAAYVKLLEGRASFGGRSSFKTFLFGVIRKTAAESRRRRAVRGLFLSRWTRRPASPPGPAPEERLMLIAALSRLPRRQRQMLQLVFYLGLTVEEAGEALGIGAGSARVHYERGKKRMGGLLGRGAREPARA